MHHKSDDNYHHNGAGDCHDSDDDAYMRNFATAGGFAKRGVGHNSSKAVQNSLQGSTSKCAKEGSKQDKCGIAEQGRTSVVLSQAVPRRTVVRFHGAVEKSTMSWCCGKVG